MFVLTWFGNEKETRFDERNTSQKCLSRSNLRELSMWIWGMERRQEKDQRKGEGDFTHSLDKSSELPNPVGNAGEIMGSKDFALADVAVWGKKMIQALQKEP